MILTVPVTVTDTGTGEETTASATASVRISFGVNTAQSGVISPDLAGITFTKSFTSGTFPGGVPSSWPGNAKYRPVPGTTTLACFLPDVAALLAGQLDAPIAAFLAGAKDGDWLTAYQEGNDASEAFWKQPGATPALLVQMHAYLHALVKRVRPSILCGQDFGTWPVSHQGQDIRAYVAPGMDFYSLDGYQLAASDTPDSVFGPAWAGIASVAPSARLVITETNTVPGVAADPAAWFTSTWEWLKARNGVLYCTWWGQGTNHFFPWPPADTSVISALQAISNECAA